MDTQLVLVVITAILALASVFRLAHSDWVGGAIFAIGAVVIAVTRFFGLL